MATVCQNNFDAKVQSVSTSLKDSTDCAGPPEVIEEKRKDADGRIISYKYARGRLLGKGGFAKCYLATSIASKSIYAIKIVSKSTLVKPRARQKLHTEIKIHKTLAHENVVRFERFFEDTDHAYMLLELCANNSMSELIRKRKRLTEPETRYYIIQLISALKFLHSSCVIHRDLKLGNLFIDSDMRLKVGDFGLATRVMHVDERKKTVCGTPNYIAPEILEGKNGHSYEVDVWSTGVVFYTLLVGKPPYESTDVKSTYKRILTNTYSFPDTVNVSEYSKSIIRNVLQTRPEKRPSWDEMLQHSFFSRTTAYTPLALPESAMRDCPSFALDDNQYSSCARSMSPMPSSQYVQDENMAPTGPLHKNIMMDKKVAANAEKPSGAVHIATTGSYDYEKFDKKSDPVSSGFAPVRRHLRSSDGGGSAGLMELDPAPATKAMPAARLAPTASYRSQLPGERTYSQQFDIYQDSKAKATVSSRESSPPVGSYSTTVQSSVPYPTQAHAPPSERMPSRLKAPTPSEALPTKSMSRASRLQEQVASKSRASDSCVTSDGGQKKTVTMSQGSNGSKTQDLDTLQMELEHVNLEHVASSERGGSAARLEEGLRCSGGGNQVRLTEAWGMCCGFDGQQQGLGVGIGQNVPMLLGDSAVSAAPVKSKAEPVKQDDLDLDNLDYNDDVDFNACENAHTTPMPQVMNKLKELGTLETMHDVLTKSFANRPQDAASTVPRSIENLPGLSAKVWVVRYVDYTSKYGLGFLLNTGSAGVYFNDSTKIVQSPDGAMFQYVERRRKNGVSAPAQMHLMTTYPPELQKKVTLLKHFRNYLLDPEQKKKTSGTASETDFGGMVVDAAASADRMSRESGLATCFDDMVSESQQLPYLKKWVRTRHAILFRLSNQTVQVVFFDQSEVLLSSEARVVTYVSKSGARSDHTLDEVLHTGRYDIAKRLKYTKDIMYRLISMPPK